jgi:hypothetical protein
VIHKPRGFLHYAKRPRQLIGTNTVFHVNDHPNGGKPLVEANRRILKYGASLSDKLFPASLTFPDPAGSEKAMLCRVAMRTGDAVRPMNLNHKGQGVIGIREILDSLKKCFRKVLFVHGERRLAQNCGCVNYIITLIW